MQAIHADIQAIFQANGMARKDAVKIVDQVKARRRNSAARSLRSMGAGGGGAGAPWSARFELPKGPCIRTANWPLRILGFGLLSAFGLRVSDLAAGFKWKPRETPPRSLR